MFDIGWTELLVIGVVALIVVGPKDLPGMFRTLGKFTARARSMAREFQRSMEAAADEAGVGDIQKDLRKVASPKSMGLDFVKDMADDFTDPEFDPEDTKRRIEETKRLDAERREKAGERPEPGENVKALAAKREADKAKTGERIEAAKKAAAARKEKAAETAEDGAAPAKPKATARKPAAKTAKAKTPAAKSAAGKKPAAKTAAVKKQTARKPAASGTTRKTATRAKAPAAAKPEASK